MTRLGPDGRDLSVMIPTYNCATYLRRTLLSLRDQGIDAAQIEVVDDASTDDPETVVAELGQGRVRFHRHDGNVGMIANFNACLERAERPFVQILHGDDYVLPGAYGEAQAVLSAHPGAVIVLGRCVVVDEDDRWLALTGMLGEGASGVRDYSIRDWSLTPVQFAGVLFEADTARSLGGFDATHPHVADWDMWWRLAKAGPTAYTNTCIGAYRHFAGNDSSRLRITASNIEQGLAQLDRIAAADGVEDLATSGLYQKLLDMAVRQAETFVDDAAFDDQIRVLRQFPVRVAGRQLARLLLQDRTARLRRRRSRDQAGFSTT